MRRTDLKQYNHRISILFNEYLQNRLDLNEFIQKLRMVEKQYEQTLAFKNPENSIWFKFSDDDTVVATIADLERDLSDSNRDFTLERMREAINLDNELFIYYS